VKRKQNRWELAKVFTGAPTTHPLNPTQEKNADAFREKETCNRAALHEAPEWFMQRSKLAALIA
jgi:hypothetical protein